MSTYTYTYPLPGGGTTYNNSYTTKKLFTPLDCSLDTILGDCGDSWNDTKCANDSFYCNPYAEGDFLYFQFKYSGLIRQRTFTVEAVRCPDGASTILTEGFHYTLEEGNGPGRKNYQNFKIITGRMPYDCFILKFYVEGCPISYTDEGPCPRTVVLATWCTDQYCPVKCDEETLLLEAEYVKYDCFGHYYAPFITGSPTNSHKSQVRIRAELFKEAFNFEETLIGDEVSRKDLKTKYTLMGHEQVPPYIAERIAETFGGRYLYIDSVKYENGVNIEKNNDQGQSWIVKTTVFGNCENNFSCG